MAWWGAKNARILGGGSRFDSNEGAGVVLGPRGNGAAGSMTNRESHGIRSFFDHLSRFSGLQILDLGMLSQSTAWYVGGLGHRINFVSLLHSFDAARTENSTEGGELSSELASQILQMELDFPPNSFHAVLAWDVLQHLDRTAMRSAIAQLSKIVRPNGVMFCLFHGEAKKGPIPLYNCSVDSASTFSIREVERRQVAQEFSARKLETLFPQFRAVHFYLKRDALLEVLVIS